jgi:hypothetical protein
MKGASKEDIVVEQDIRILSASASSPPAFATLGFIPAAISGNKAKLVCI